MKSCWTLDASRCSLSAMSEEAPKNPGGDTFVDFRYNGVQGWLRFLVFVLVLLRPLFSLVQIANLIKFYKESGGSSDLTVPIYVEVATLVLLAGFSVYAGICLARVSKGAAQTAKRYFVTEIIASFVLAWADFQIASAFGKADSGEAFVGILKAILAAGVWLLYLSQSRRVKATYRS